LLSDSAPVYDVGHPEARVLAGEEQADRACIG